MKGVPKDGFWKKITIMGLRGRALCIQITVAALVLKFFPKSQWLLSTELFLTNLDELARTTAPPPHVPWTSKRVSHIGYLQLPWGWRSRGAVQNPGPEHTLVRIAVLPRRHSITKEKNFKRTSQHSGVFRAHLAEILVGVWLQGPKTKPDYIKLFFKNLNTRQTCAIGPLKRWR